MIRALVESAFQTGCLSVESEGLLHQVLATKSYHSEDLAAIAALCEAVNAGQIQRESRFNTVMKFPLHRQSC